MPEITSRERIIEKLRDFDERMDGAIAAAKILAVVKADAEKMRDSMQDALQESIETQDRLQDLQVEWAGLKQDVADAKKQLLSEIHQTLINHKELERMSREHEENAAADCETVIAQVNRLQELLKSSKLDLEAEITANLNRSAELIQSKINEAERHLDEKQQAVSRRLEEKTDNFNSTLHSKMEIFKEEVKKELHEHQQGVERHLTGFLNKQLNFR